MAEPLVVIKVGGSLYDLPDLGPRLIRLLDRPECRPAILVPGGGPLVDVIRRLDQVHGLGEEAAHWLAIDVMTVMAHVLARLLPHSQIVGGPEEAEAVAGKNQVAILNARRFLEQDEERAGALPHSWGVTSDAIAARLAIVWGARRLLLLKSVSMAEPIDWTEASRLGLVDPQLPALLKDHDGLVVEAINFRQVG